MSVNEGAQVGDIIKSSKFAFGYYDYEDNADGTLSLLKTKITVDGRTTLQKIGYAGVCPTCKRSSFGSNLEHMQEIEVGAYDESRGEALFVVVTACLDGGGEGHGPGDTYPDGWHIKARRLNDDGTYNSNGEWIDFYQSGCFTNLIREIEIVGKMKQDTSWKVIHNKGSEYGLERKS